MKRIQAKSWVSGLLFFLIILTLPVPAITGQEEPDTVGSYIYWDDGINLTGPWRDFDLKIGGKINYDLGDIQAGRELQAAFPDFDGLHHDFRRLSVSLFGHAWQMLEFKFEIDFANTRDIKDNWVRFTRGAVLSSFTIGHMKEPFSLDMLTSSNYLTFMEFSLPTKAYTPFRNFGVTYSGTLKKEKMTWAGGFFLNTGSFGNVGAAQDRISEASGFNLTGRITGLPVYRQEGKELVHLGFSYSHRFRNDDKEDPTTEFRARPESRLTDDRLVDTSLMYDQGQNLFSLEAAWMNGPYLIQGEYFQVFVDSTSSLNFNGWYLQGSWFLTGETHKYQTSGGVFSGINPEREFHLRKSGWGAWELALRYSQVDLNDKFIRGGEERNITVGLNWYLRRKIRFMINYIHVKAEDRDDPTINNGRADIIQSRFQINF